MPKKINSKKLKEYLLVYVDESDEFLEAMMYACELAKTESLGIISVSYTHLTLPTTPYV